MGKKDHSERLHSSLGASNSSRWLNCPGSVALEAISPPQVENRWAAEGTRAHETLEEILRAFWEELDEKYMGLLAKTSESIAVVVKYVVRELQSRECEMILEEKVDLGFIDPELFGTIDVCLVEQFGMLEVIDFKNGFAPVDPKDNTQLIYYALGIAERYGFDFETVRLTIAQPNAEGLPPIRSWDLSIDELRSFIPLFTKGVKRTREKNAKLFAGGWCKYCRASVKCPELAAKSLAAVKVEFEDIETELELPHPNDLTPTQMNAILANAKKLEIWINDVRNYAVDLLKRGGTVEGYELVPTRPQRQWKDENAAAWAFAKVVDDPYIHKLKSPAQMEKEVSKKDQKLIEDMSHKVSSGLTLGEKNDTIELKRITTKKEITNGNQRKTRSQNRSKEKASERKDHNVSSQLSKRVRAKTDQRQRRS